MLHRRDQRRREEAVRGVEQVANRQRVPDGEQAPLGTREQHPQAASVTGRRLRAALTATRRLERRRLRRGPGAIGEEWAALVAAEVDLVQLGDDDVRDAAPVERQLQGLLGAAQLGGDAEVDRLAGEVFAEPPRLLPPRVGQPLARRGARRDAVPVRDGERMTYEDELSQSSTER